MSQYFKDLLDDLMEQLSDGNTLLDQRHFRLLANLSAVEKQALARLAIEWNWNVGSPIVMKFLQNTSILNMSETILCAYNQNVESAQLIFNDLLETEHQLLADLLKHANSTDPMGLSLCDLLNEGFKRLCNDVIENPSILVKNYLDEVEEYIQDECFEEIRCMHLKLLLNDGPKHTLSDALSNQCTWNNEIKNEHVLFKSFLTSIVGCDYRSRRKTFDTILSKCDDWNSEGWKHLLLLLRIVVDVEECAKFNHDERNYFKATVKKFLKDTFRSAVNEEDENGLQVLFLIARQISQYNESLIGNYATWFKDTIGEMKYFLKANEFTLTMQSLAGMVHLEFNSDFLDVHINTYMPAPPRCNQLVLNYKQLCQSRQMYLKSLCDSNANQLAAVEEDVFLIDDD